MRPFEGKVALITGSSRGIGRAIALRLAEGGASIAVNYVKDQAAAKDVAAQVQAQGARALVVQADVGRVEDIRRMFRQGQEEFGGLDIFVANAAATAFKPLLEVREHHIQRTFDITVRGFIVACQEAVRLMEGRRGRIIAMSGWDTLRCIPGHGLLGAAKAAMETLCRYLTCELAGRNIVVNSVCPGSVETESTRLYSGGRWETWSSVRAAASPYRRLGTPDDVARVVAFLCSDAGEWVCGQNIIVDGAVSINAPSPNTPFAY